jgi:hypothetical protein
MAHGGPNLGLTGSRQFGQCRRFCTFCSPGRQGTRTPSSSSSSTGGGIRLSGGRGPFGYGLPPGACGSRPDSPPGPPGSRPGAGGAANGPPGLLGAPFGGAPTGAAGPPGPPPTGAAGPPGPPPNAGAPPAPAEVPPPAPPLDAGPPPPPPPPNAGPPPPPPPPPNEKPPPPPPNEPPPPPAPPAVLNEEGFQSMGAIASVFALATPTLDANRLSPTLPVTTARAKNCRGVTSCFLTGALIPPRESEAKRAACKVP